MCVGGRPDRRQRQTSLIKLNLQPSNGLDKDIFGNGCRRSSLEPLINSRLGSMGSVFPAFLIPVTHTQLSHHPAH